MNYSAKNILTLTDPQEYRCIVWGYKINHSLMLVRADKYEFGKETFYLIFEGVLYFEGPIRWKGADFCIATADECAKLLYRLELDVFQEVLLDKYRLFVVELPNSEVKILATNVIQTEDYPADFYGVETSP